MFFSEKQLIFKKFKLFFSYFMLMNKMKTRRGGMKWRAAFASMLGVSSGLASASSRPALSESQKQNLILKELRAKPNNVQSVWEELKLTGNKRGSTSAEMEYPSL